MSNTPTTTRGELHYSNGLIIRFEVTVSRAEEVAVTLGSDVDTTDQRDVTNASEPDYETASEGEDADPSEPGFEAAAVPAFPVHEINVPPTVDVYHPEAVLDHSVEPNPLYVPHRLDHLTVAEHVGTQTEPEAPANPVVGIAADQEVQAEPEAPAIPIFDGGLDRDAQEQADGGVQQEDVLAAAVRHMMDLRANYDALYQYQLAFEGHYGDFVMQYQDLANATNLRLHTLEQLHNQERQDFYDLVHQCNRILPPVEQRLEGHDQSLVDLRNELHELRERVGRSANPSPMTLLHGIPLELHFEFLRERITALEGGPPLLQNMPRAAGVTDPDAMEVDNDSYYRSNNAQASAGLNDSESQDQAQGTLRGVLARLMQYLGKMINSTTRVASNAQRD